MILFSGCSYVEGAELENRYEERFSRLVSDHFGLKELNVSRGGGSNKRVVRTIIDSLNKDVTAVVIGWTNPYRSEIFLAGKWRVINVGSIPRFDKTISTYYSQVNFGSVGLADHFRYVKQIQTLCEYGNIPCVMFNSLPIGNKHGEDIPPEETHGIDLSEKFWLLDPLDPFQTFRYLSEGNQHENGHPRKESHRKLADLIIEKLSTQI